MPKMKIGIVIHRFGQDVIGGAEAHAYKIAKQMSQYWDIDIITTKARDYVSWADSYDENQTYDNEIGVNVLRFSVDRKRDMNSFSHFSALLENKIKCNFEVSDKEAQILSLIHI